MGWIALSALLAASVPAAGAGRPEGVRAAAFGFDASDATRALRAAIGSGAGRVIVEDMGVPWVIGETIRLASDQEIVFEEGVEVVAKAGAFRGKAEVLFDAEGGRNVVLTGRGATLRMRKADYQGEGYEKSEWRHLVRLRACTNVTIVGMTLAESGGDGIYVGAGKGGEPCLGVTIRNVTCADNHRQGISVISAEDLLIEDCVLKGTRGTAPQAGIDFEPNRPDERLVGCVMRRCVVEGNAGRGLLFALQQLRGASAPIAIRIEDCEVRGNGQEAVRFHVKNGEGADAVRGRCDFVDCRFGAAGPPPISISGNAPAGVGLRFERCRIDATGVADASRRPVEFAVRAEDVGPIGGAVFVDCVIEDRVDRAPIGYAGGLSGWGIEGVSGTLSVSRGGVGVRHVVDAAALAKWIPIKRFRRFEGRAYEPMAFAPLAAGEYRGGEGGAPRVRGRATYLLWAGEGDEVILSGKVMPVGRAAARDVVLGVTSPSGKAMRALKVAADGPPEMRFGAGEAGAYRLSCEKMEPGATLVLDSPTHRLCLFSSGGPIGLFRSLVPLYFAVPEGTSAFGLRVSGAGGAEKVGLAVVDAAGQLALSREAIGDTEQLLFDGDAASRPGIWELRFAKPATGVLEDFSILAEGIPSIFAWRKGALVGPRP